ncbi:hypothetical protein PIB30_016570 [Stylosanthes scabra]|uniref:RNase H type-1 domain-containing protein n=1 Tax=Stylosanthes scabra TaxID=79078 RepID=A0ABU6S7N8_9FABA|nr:hypothetical protein [Stylosanthes scabra]
MAAATWRIDSDLESHLAEAQACVLEVILAITNARIGDNYFGFCIADCLNLTNSFRSMVFLHVKREGNRVAHALANLALYSPGLIWLEEAPDHICNLALLDCLSPMMS